MKKSVKTRDCHRSWSSGAAAGRRTAHSARHRSEKRQAHSPLLARPAANRSASFAGTMSGCTERRSSMRIFCSGARLSTSRSNVNHNYSREPARTSWSVRRMAPSLKKSKTKISKLQFNNLINLVLLRMWSLPLTLLRS